MKKIITVACFSLLFAIPAQAESNQVTWQKAFREGCENIENFTSLKFTEHDKIALATITSDSDLMGLAWSTWEKFYTCTASPLNCSVTGKVAKDSLVLLNAHKDGFYCVYPFADFSNQKADLNDGKWREQLGWVADKNLLIINTQNTEASEWVGKWERINPGPSNITIVSHGSELHITGQALYYYKPNEANIGAIDFKEPLRGNFLIHMSKDSTCGIIAFKNRNHIIVVDNHACGGHNVTFTGTYKLSDKQ